MSNLKSRNIKNPQGKIISTERFYNGRLDLKEVFNYDANGNKILTEHYRQTQDGDTGGTKFFKETFEYGLTGVLNNKIIDYRRYNDGTNLSYKEVHTYDVDGVQTAHNIYPDGVNIFVPDVVVETTREDGCCVCEVSSP
jgi:hypothetical protein